MCAYVCVCVCVWKIILDSVQIIYGPYATFKISFFKKQEQIFKEPF